MAWRISCGMIRREGARASVLVLASLVSLVSMMIACRGDAAAPSEPPKAAGGEPSSGAATPAPTPAAEASMTTPDPDPPPGDVAPGPPLAAADVGPAFQRWWTPWSKEHLATHPLKDRLDELAARGGTVKEQACDALADHVADRAPAGSPERLLGDPAALRGRGERCWWLHHDGLMGPGLGAALASDGTVRVVWIVSEG